jgi:hypothetical protein
VKFFIENILFVGRSDGNVQVFKVLEKNGIMVVEQITQVSLGSAKPVDSIEYISITQLVVCLKEGKFIVAEGESMERVNKGTKLPKNLDLLTVDRSEFLSRIAVVEKSKHIMVYEVSKSSIEKLCEHTTHNSVVCMRLLNEHLYFATKKRYMMMDVPSGEVKEMHVPIEGDVPVIEIYDNHELVMSAINSLIVFVHFDGTPSARSTIQCSFQPIEISVSGNYLIVLEQSDTVEIFSLIDDVQHVQTFKINMAKNCSVDYKGFYLGLIWNEECIDYLKETPIEYQIQQYLDSKRLEKALALFMKSEPSAEETKSFYLQAGFAYMKHFEFIEAANLFLRSRVDPRELIALFPDLSSAIGLDYKKSELLNYPKDINAIIREGKEIIERIPKEEAKDGKIQEVLEASSKTLIHSALIGLGSFLWKWRSYRLGRNPNEEIEAERIPIFEAVDSALLVLEVDMSGKTEAVFPRRKRISDSALIDELPFKARDILLPKNFCNLSKMELYLSARQNFNSLSLLYFSKGLTRKALAGFAKLASGEWIDPGFFGVNETIEVLQTLDDSPILWEYLDWVLMKEPHEALAIFAKPRRKTEIEFSKVVKILTETESKLKKANKKIERLGLLEAYLEYLVFDRSTTDQQYHDQLGLLYLKSYEAMLESGTSDRSLVDEARAKLRRFLFESKYYDAHRLLTFIKNLNLWDELFVLYSRLELHLEMLELCVYNLQLHETAWKYCADGGLVQSPTKEVSNNFVEFSNKHFLEKQQRLFSILLKIYCFPDVSKMPKDESKDSYLTHALQLCSIHSAFMNPIDILRCLPNHVPVSDIASFFEKMIPPLIHRKRSALITRNLSSAQNLSASILLNESKRKFFYISKERVCPVCKSPMGEKVFRGYPNGDVVHYNCVMKYEEKHSKKSSS